MFAVSGECGNPQWFEVALRNAAATFKALSGAGVHNHWRT